MRPLTLRLNGLRSYLTDQEIDFVDVDLMAVVGDTGAGKSSLLEALCVALYGCCTWDARGAKPLIADGATTLRVELTFRVGEKTWRVTRAISKGPYPPAIHLLECLDDGTRIDNGDPVNAAIRRLIGLDFSTFLKAVVLPQGRFQILLQMSNTDRTPILKSILGLDQLITVREAALELSRRLRPQLAALEQRRAALLPDPQAARRDARRRLKIAKAEVASLDADKKKIAQLRATQGQANARARAAESATERIAGATVADAVEAYGRLMAIESDLSATGNRARNELSALEVGERALQEVLDDADHSGVGIAQLAAAKATITSLIGELPELSAERERCTAEAASIASDRHDLTSRRANVAALEAEARQADIAAKSADAAARGAQESLDAARDGLDGARIAAQAAAEAARNAQEAATLLEQRETEAAEADQQARLAEQAHAAAVGRLDAVRRSAAAAHAASGSHAGDPCPICARALPDGFVAPEPPGETEAQSACSVAEKEAKSRARIATAAFTNAENARAALGVALADSDELEKRRIAAIEHMDQLLGRADLSITDDELLAESRALVDATATALTDARASAQTNRDEITSANAELHPAEGGLTARETALTIALATLKRREQNLRESVAHLPSDFRVAEPYSDDALQQQSTRVEQRQNELVENAEQLSVTRGQIGQVRATLKDVESRWNKEIDAPAKQLRRGVERLADRAAEASALLEEPPGPAELPEGSLADEAEWARATVAMAAAIADRLDRQVRADSDAATTAADEISAAFAAVGVEDDAGLEERLVAASAEARIAAKDVETAEAQAPVAADLDGRITTGGPFVDAVDELVRLLADGKFLGAVVKRKQRALLGVASELLADMTAQRFGFAEGFQIVDGLSGQPRDVKTLSGGETFLASLALGLALVELAGRGGGRVEALFLDEGFGSLDANSLTEALDALSRQADGGRLVAIISHLHAVAENIEHVLVVTKGPAGSQVRWAKDLEREELIADELKSGLLT